MRWTLRIFTALVLICASLGPVGSAWAAPGNGNDVGQGNGHGQGLQTAPGQTGVPHGNNSSAPSNTGQVTPSSGNAAEHANANSADHSNAPSGADHGNASSGAEHGNANGAGGQGPDNGNGGGQAQDNGVIGNSGTIKISSDPLSTSSMANQPHPGCTFYILGYGFPTTTGTYSISPQPANGNGPAGSTTSRESPISYANGASSPYPVVVQQSGSRYNLQIGPITDFTSGQYKVYVNSDNTPGGAKQKVFRLDCPSGNSSAVTESPEETAPSAESASAPSSSPPSTPAATTSSTESASGAPSTASATAANGESASAPSSQSGSASGAPSTASATAASGEGGSAQSPAAFNAAQPSLQGIDVAGEQVSVPAGVPIEQNGDTATVTGPAVVMVGSQPQELAPGEVMVLGVQAQQVAPNTGIGGLVATDYVYRVQPGDTLESIATNYYGDSAYAWSIYQANADALDGSTVLVPGIVLHLP